MSHLAAADSTATVVTTASERRNLFRLMECRLLHRADWQYVETTLGSDDVPWPVDTYHCQRCERVWQRAS
jgi:hypothetical protein